VIGLVYVAVMIPFVLDGALGGYVRQIATRVVGWPPPSADAA
jgi:hypothetical protein